MLSVETLSRVEEKRRSHCSIASQRSSSGVRFQRSHLRQMTQRRPLAASKARRRPVGNDSITSFEPRSEWQNRQVVYISALTTARYIARFSEVEVIGDGGDLFRLLPGRLE